MIRSAKRVCNGALCTGILAWAGFAQAAEAYPTLRFSADSLAFEDTRLTGIAFSLDGEGAFSVAADSIELPDSDGWRQGLELLGRLDALEQNAQGLAASGQARYEDLPFDFSLALENQGSEFCLATQARLLGAALAEAAGPEALAWAREGKVESCVGYRDEDGQARVSIELELLGIAFDSPEGLYAGEGLDIDIDGELQLGAPWQGQLSARLRSGAVLFDQLYAEFAAAPLRLDVLPRFQGERLAAVDFDVTDGGGLAVDGRVDWDEAGVWLVQILELSMAFPAAYTRYLETMAAALTLDGLEVTGGLRWAGAIGSAGLESGDLDLLDLTVVDRERGRFALTGLTTRLRPGAPEFDSTLDWRGLMFGRINLGPGRAHLDSSPGLFALAQPLDLGVLGGSLQLQRLAYRMPSGGATPRPAGFEFQARAEGIELERLTAALDWPDFGGTLGGEIPRVHLDDGVLNVEGEIRVDVFGGSIRVADLAVERPFGVLPSLSANAEIRDLDLEQLTRTFEFGSISGRVDGYVRDLRLLDWSPVAFDAWLGTPERQSRSRSISRQAVNHLAAIGGGGAAAALAGPVMRLFNNISYRRLGLGCRLENYVCQVTGVREDGEGVLLLEGAGIPKVTVRAYNRRVDWPQMVSNLVAVGSGESIRVGEGDGP